MALAAALVAIGVVPAAAQEHPDTLLYDIAVVTDAPAHFSVEARLTTSAPGPVTLASPPMAPPAGTDVEGLSATDDHGRPLRVERVGTTYRTAAPAGALRFRYRLGFPSDVALSSTGAGLDDTHLYAISRSVFVAPDPSAYRASGTAYPRVLVHIAAPRGWHVVTSWGVDDDVFAPAGGDALLGATIAAAPDFRVYRDTAARTPLVLAIRGRRPFSDSALLRVIGASLRRAAAVLGPVPVPRVTYTSEVGSKGRSSGSLQGLASIALVWEASEPLELPRIHDLFHETLHLWFGGAMNADRWWIEGVTDYLAARLESEWSGRAGDLADLCYQSLRDYLRIDRRDGMTMGQEQREGVLGDNTTLLVYRKGMLAGLLLDAAIRRATSGHAGLDDLARRALARAVTDSANRVPDREMRVLAVELGGDDTDHLWRRVVDGTSLITEAEVTAALRLVTGLPITAPAAGAEEQTLLIGHPNP